MYIIYRKLYDGSYMKQTFKTREKLKKYLKDNVSYLKEVDIYESKDMITPTSKINIDLIKKGE